MSREELDQGLAEKRIILLDGDIDDEMAAAVKFWLMLFNTQSKEEIKLLIDSDGGMVQAAMSIYDLVKLSAAPVTGLVVGDCKSMAIILLQACTTRLATPHSNFYIHELNWKSGTIILDKDAKDMLKAKMKELKLIRNKIINILTGRPRLTPTMVDQLMSEGENKGTYLLAERALKLGLIDKIVESYPLF